MSKESPPDEGPTEPPNALAGPTILQRIGRALLYLLYLVAKRCRTLDDRSASAFSWIWQNRWTAFEFLMVWFFRATALLSVGYLVYDRVYETGVTISSTGSDLRNPLYFPFAIANNSHIFTLEHIEWTCHIVRYEAGSIDFTNNSMTITGSAAEMPPGGILNVPCKNMFNGFAPPRRAELYLEVSYDTNIFGMYTLKRKPRMLFTWAADSTNPQWIKGEFAK